MKTVYPAFCKLARTVKIYEARFTKKGYRPGIHVVY
jgi:hypothetical protein